jgi:hypothetical protein
MTITYIRGEDNTVADALSRLPPNAYPDESLTSIPPHVHWTNTNTVNAVLS